MAAAAAYNESRGTSSKVVRYNNTILALETVRSSFEIVLTLLGLLFLLLFLHILYYPAALILAMLQAHTSWDNLSALEKSQVPHIVQVSDVASSAFAGVS